MLSPSGQQQYFYLWIPSVLKACHQNYQGLIVTTVMQPFKQQVYLSADNDAIIFTERELQLQEFKNHLPFTFSTKCNINDTDVTVKVSVSGHIQEKKVKVKTDRPNVEDDTITEILLPDTIGTDEITGFIVSNKPIDGSSSSNSNSSSSSSSSKKVSVVTSSPSVTVKVLEPTYENKVVPFLLRINSNTEHTAKVYAYANDKVVTKDVKIVPKPTLEARLNLKLNLVLVPSYLLTNSNGYAVSYLTDEQGRLYIPDKGLIPVYFTSTDDRIAKVTNVAYITASTPYAVSGIYALNNGVVRITASSPFGTAEKTLRIGQTIESATMQLDFYDPTNKLVHTENIDLTDPFQREKDVTFNVGEGDLQQEVKVTVTVNQTDFHTYTVTPSNANGTYLSAMVSLNPTKSVEYILDTPTAIYQHKPFLASLTLLDKTTAKNTDKPSTVFIDNGNFYKIIVSKVEQISTEPRPITFLEDKDAYQIALSIASENVIKSRIRTTYIREITPLEQTDNIKINAGNVTVNGKGSLAVEMQKELLVLKVGADNNGSNSSSSNSISINAVYFVVKTTASNSSTSSSTTTESSQQQSQSESLTVAVDSDPFDVTSSKGITLYSNAFLADTDSIMVASSSIFRNYQLIFEPVKVTAKDVTVDYPSKVHVGEKFSIVAYDAEGNPVKVRKVITMTPFVSVSADDNDNNTITLLAEGKHKLTVVTDYDIKEIEVDGFLADFQVFVLREFATARFTNDDAFSYQVIRPKDSVLEVSSVINHKVDTVSERDNVITDKVTFYPDFACEPCSITFNVNIPFGKPFTFNDSVFINEFRTLTVKMVKRLNEEPIDYKITLERGREDKVEMKTFEPLKLQVYPLVEQQQQQPALLLEQQQQQEQQSTNRNEVTLTIPSNFEQLQLVSLTVNGEDVMSKYNKDEGKLTIVFMKDTIIKAVYGKTVSLILTPAEHTKGTGVYELGQQVTVRADEKIDVVPFLYSKKFTQWSDGSKEPARLITLQQNDTVLQAEYKDDYSLLILPIVLVLTIVILKKVITSYMERKYEEMLSEI
jgi:hypothetical protein